MVDAAEQIVAEQGMPMLTFKAVQTAAGQSNKSAAKYHFGSREGLLDAVVDARMAPVNARRHAMLQTLEQSDGVPTIRQLVEALILPLVAETLCREGSRYGRFLAQALFDPALAEIIQKHLRADSYITILQLLTDRCPAPADIASWRARSVVMLNMTTIASLEAMQWTPDQRDALVADLITTCVAALSAPFDPSIPDSQE